MEEEKARRGVPASGRRLHIGIDAQTMEIRAIEAMRDAEAGAQYLDALKRLSPA